MKSVPELARDGGRRGPEDAEPLAEGVGGLMEDEEDPTAEADDGGLTGVLLLKRRGHNRYKQTREQRGGRVRDNKRRKMTCCCGIWSETVQAK